MLNDYAKRLLADLALEVVEELVQEIDSEGQHFPNALSLQPLQEELVLVLDGRIGDWEIEERQKHGKVPHA